MSFTTALLMALPLAVRTEDQTMQASLATVSLDVSPSINKAKAPVPDPGVLAAFDELESYIEKQSDDRLDSQARRSLLANLENAEQAYRLGSLCQVLNMIKAYLNELQAIRQAASKDQGDPGRVALAEELYNRGRTLGNNFVGPYLKNPSLFLPSPCIDPSLPRDPVIKHLASNNKRFSARVALGAPSLSTLQRGGETWTQLSIPAVQSLIGVPGQPAVPSWQALVAIPHGAKAVLSQPSAHVRETIFMNLYPYQHQAADLGSEQSDPFRDPPFVKDPKAYATNAFFPSSPCAFRPLGQLRDLQIGQVQCAAGQYNPVTNELRLFGLITFELRFEGGDGTFITDRMLSPFEPASTVAMDSVLNRPTLPRYVRYAQLERPPCSGEELLILTHPDFHDAADELARWKRDKGIATTIAWVGPGTFVDTAEKIDTLIESRYDNCVVRPSYVLIIGDSEFVPPARTDYNTKPACDECGDETTGSDWGYAIHGHTIFDFLFPSFAVGRIPVDTPDEAQIVVDKIIGYESNPPDLGVGSGGPFYTTASVASYFQCCRTDVSEAGRDMRNFVETTELVRNQLLSQGYTVERIYGTDTNEADDTVADPTPRRYYDGTWLPTGLVPGSGFAWDGNTTDVVDAFNQGRFNILHRGHADMLFWTNPSFSITHLSRLTNGALLPVVYSINCESGFWDRETDAGDPTLSESLMERLLLLAGGGMVSGIGDVRNSPTWANSAFTRGLYDATWPGMAPEFGTATSLRRLGDILDHGKIYLITQIGVAYSGEEVTLDAVLAELVLWHVVGDPTLEMWTRNPNQRILPGAHRLQPLSKSILVRYGVEGATITAFQRSSEGLIPFGRGTVKAGVAKIQALNPLATAPTQKNIVLSASFPNAVSILLTVPSDNQAQ
jgi:hypothetical protein